MSAKRPLETHDDDRDPIDRVIQMAETVHKELGPGLSESTYRNAVCVLLKEEHIKYTAEQVIVVTFRGEFVGQLRADIVVDGSLVVELKCVARIADQHVAQTRAYMRRIVCESGDVKGVVLNFGSVSALEVRRV